MSAQITHELRNPLSSIGLNSELLLEEFGQKLEEIDLPASQELLRNITKEVDRLRDITEEYLQFARLPEPKKLLFASTYLVKKSSSSCLVSLKKQK